MNFGREGGGEISDIPKVKGKSEQGITAEAAEKFDVYMGDDMRSRDTEDMFAAFLDSDEINGKFDKMSDEGDFFEMFEKRETPLETDYGEEAVIEGGKESLEVDFDYETDDEGRIYKKDGELLPDTEYTVNDNTYKTNERGNIISCDSRPEYTEEGVRNMKEQKEAGGEERREDDEGGHIVARVLGGAEGEENLVPMRRTINRGDYKKMENEIARALQDGMDVTLHIDIVYDGNSGRPSSFRAEYEIDGRKTTCEFDNVEGSQKLMDSLEDKISAEDCGRLKQTIEEMKEDGVDAAITSVKVEYGEDGEPGKVTVGILNEAEGTKTYREYAHRDN